MKPSTCFTRWVVALLLLSAYYPATKGQYTPGQFINDVPIPYLLEGVSSQGTTAFTLDFEPAFHNFDPNGATTNGLPLTPSSTILYKIDTTVRTWAINSSGPRIPANAPDMTYLGATVLWQHGATVDMAVTNNLPTGSSTEPGQGQTTTSHWHGLNVPSFGDGGPHQAIPNAGPNQTWSPAFPIVDPAQTIWYHSHVMDYTTEQVIMGLSGIIIIGDSTDPTLSNLNDALPHNYGANDFPLIIQEKGFNYDSVFSGNDTILVANSMKVGEKPGDGQFRIVNGVALGNLEVPNSMVRFRVLNGDPRKSYNFGFSTNIDTSDINSRLTFYQVASDGGYMGKAHPIQSFLVNPGERGEFIIDFSSNNIGNATEVFLSNLSSDPSVSSAHDIVGLGGDKNNAGPLNPGFAFMKFTVNPNIVVPDPKTSVPDSTMFPAYVLDNCPSPKARTKVLMDSLFVQPAGMWTIDGTPMDMGVLNDTICVNTCEEWTIRNTTPVAHPFHIHKVQFQITKYIDGSNGTPVTYEYPNLPSNMMGYKDVIIVRKSSEVTFQARFDDFGDAEIDPTNGYMYHCHILTHEDFSMMHQFTVINDSLCTVLGLNSVDPGLSKDFVLYPNPAGDVLFLRGTSARGGKIRISDMLGRVLREQDLAPFEGDTPISISGLPKGMVLVTFSVGDQQFSKKILLK